MTTTLSRELSWRFPMMKGDDVREVQRALIRDGSLDAGADGIFGQMTSEAVKQFQRKLRERNPKIDVDGVVGRDTWSALFPDLASTKVVSGFRVASSVRDMPQSGDKPLWQSEIDPYMKRLEVDHGSKSQAPGGIRWKLTQDGIVIEGQAKPCRTGGEPKTIQGIWRTFRIPIEKCAAAYCVPVELILATIATESGGKPESVREEPGYVSDEETPHKVSPGLMQTLISTARETLREPGLTRKDLFSPENSIRAGTSYIRRQAQWTNFDPPLVACAYNAGGLYDQDGAENRWKLRQYPIGKGTHADRFVDWLGDAMYILGEAEPDMKPHKNTPSFRTLFSERSSPV